MCPDLVGGCGLRDREAKGSVSGNHTKYPQQVSEVGGWRGEGGEGGAESRGQIGGGGGGGGGIYRCCGGA